MAIEVSEKWNSRKVGGGSSPSVEVGYLIVGTFDEAAAGAALLEYVPATWGNAPIQDWNVEQISDLIWDASVIWSFQQLTPPTEDGEAQTSFSTKGGRAKITQSRGTTRYAKSGETAPDYKGAIQVERSGSNLQVHGTEIPIPALSFTKTRRFPATWLTAARLKSLASLTGSTNASEFLGFEPGELVFEGAEGTQKGAEPVDVRFEFNASQNVTNQTFGEITGIDKKGWQFLWFLFKEEEDTDAKEVVKRPQAAYVETVLPATDFSGLGIS